MLWENHIPIKLRKREREIHKHWQDSMDNVISLQPLDGTLAHNYSPRCHFIGMGDRYSAKTTGTGTNQVLHGRRVSATEDRCDLVFLRGNRENLYTPSSGFTSAEFYGFGKRVERKQKGPSPPASDVFVYLLIFPSLHLRTRVSRGHRQSCTHGETVHLQTDT